MPELKATKEQVKQMLKDMEASFMRERNAARVKALEAEGALAQKYADEMKRRAAQYGYVIEASVTFSQGGNPVGWTRGRSPIFRMK
jgi:hypothetical protein